MDINNPPPSRRKFCGGVAPYLETEWGCGGEQNTQTNDNTRANINNRSTGITGRSYDRYPGSARMGENP